MDNGFAYAIGNRDGFRLFLVCLVFLAAGMLFGGWEMYNVGHTQGVKDHAAGRYVVVPMPDGTEQVCEVKEASK